MKYLGEWILIQRNTELSRVPEPESPLLLLPAAASISTPVSR